MKLHIGNCNEHSAQVVDPTINCWAIRDEDRRKIGTDELMAYITDLETFARTVVDEVLFPLSHRQGDDLSIIAEGLGSQSASLLNP